VTRELTAKNSAEASRVCPVKAWFRLGGRGEKYRAVRSKNSVKKRCAANRRVQGTPGLPLQMLNTMGGTGELTNNPTGAMGDLIASWGGEKIKKTPKEGVFSETKLSKGKG